MKTREGRRRRNHPRKKMMKMTRTGIPGVAMGSSEEDD